MNKNILLTVFSLFIVAFASFSQSNFMIVNTSFSNDITVCENSATFDVNMENPSPFAIINDTVYITLPTGVTYSPGSIVNGVEIDITDNQNLIFTISDIPSLSFYDFSIEITAACEVEDFLLNGGQLINDVLFSYDAQNTNGTLTPGTQQESSNVYSVFIPNLSITSITNQSYNAVVGDVFDRCITIINGGSGPLSEFTIVDQHSVNVNVNAISIGQLTNVVNGDEFYLSGVDFMTIGNSDGFLDPGESIVICETMEILTCEDASSTYSYWWGCNNDTCQIQTDAANINFPGEVPDLQFTPSSTYSTSVLNDNCYGNNATGDFEASLEIENVGSGVAYDVEIDLFQGWTLAMVANYYSSLNPNSFTIQVNAGAPVPLTFDNTYNSTAKPCLPANPIGRVVFTIDSIMPTDVIVISFNHFTCCHDHACTNTERKHLLGWRFEGTYRNSCFQDYPILLTQGVYTGYYRNTLVLDGSPGTLLGSSTGNVSFLSSNFEFPFPRNTANDQFIYQAILPPCLTVDIASFQITAANGTIMSAPNSTSVSGDTVNFVYDNYVGGVQATASFDVILDCATCGTTGPQSIQFNTLYTPDLACNCQFKMGCETADIELACPVLCEGANLLEASCERKNFGLTDNDNDGLPDPIATPMNFNLVKTDRLMYGDTLYVRQVAYVHDPNNINWSNLIGQTTITDVGTRMNFENEVLTIYNASNTLYYSCDPASLLTTTALGGNSVEFVHDIDIAALAGACFPAGFDFDTGDSIIWEREYSNNVNIGGAIISSNVENVLNLSVSPYSAGMPATDLFGCNTITKSFTLIGYYWTNYGPNSYVVQDCNQFTTTQNFYLSIGICCNNYAGGNLFPYEYRNWGAPSLLSCIMPDDYTYISSRFNFVRTAGTLVSATEPWFDLTPTAVVGNQYDFDVSGYFGDNILTDSILFGDDGFHGTLQLTFEPNCNIADSTGYIGYEFSYDPANQLLTSATAPQSNVYTHDEITYISPLLNMQTNLVNVNTSNGSVDWTVTITNSSNLATGSNLWLGAPTLGTVIADSLYSNVTNTVFYPNANGIFDLDQIGPVTVNTYQLYTHINSCQPDSILIYFGWGCTGVPLDIASYECELSSKKLTINPLFPELENNITITSNDTIPLCAVADYEITVRNFQLGDAYNLFTDIILPSGLTIIPGSCAYTYGTNAGAIPDPTFIGGTTFQWDINAVIPALNNTGLQGIYDQTLNSFTITFQVNSSCDYVSGERIYVQSLGEAFCGQVFTAIPEFSEQLFITDALPPYEAIIKLGIDFITPCSGGSQLDVTIINQGSQAFTVNDSVSVGLWPGVTYSAGSYVAGINPPIGPVTITNINGFEELSWPLPGGVAVGDSTTFSLFLDADPSVLQCGIIQISANSTTSGASICNSTACNISVVTGDTTKNIFIYKAYLDLLNGTATSLPNPPTGESVTVGFDIFNSGETIIVGSETIIQYYNDDDGNGVLSPTDTYLTNDTITNALLNNTTFNYSSTIDFDSPNTCRIIAVIDTSLVPCICATQQILLNINFWSPIDTFETCSGVDINIGTDPINNYMYNWQNPTNLDDPNVAQPVFNFVNVYPTTDTLLYIRDIQKLGCATEDTSIVIVYSIPISQAGIDQDLCGLYSTALAATGPLGTDSGLWSEDASAANPSIITFIDSSDPLTDITGLAEGTYSLIWTLTNGSCTPVNDTVVINVYDPPVSDAGLDQQLCNTYTTLLTGNNPAGTSTGMWSEDATSANPSVVVFGDATAFNSSISSLIEGTYSLVWTVSNGICTPVTDTVLIDVSDTPVAIAGADIDLCNIYTSTLPGAVPVGTSTGFWTANPTATNPGIITYVDSTDANTSISGLVEGAYSLLWTVENGSCLPDVDTLIINVYDQPIANAGIDIDTCNTTGALLQGNSALGTATGLWSEDANVANPSVVVFTDATDESTSINGLIEGSYSIVWTLSNGTCLDDSDTVTVNVYDIPTVDAGIDQDLCNIYTTGLAASPATGVSTGVWSEDATASNPSVVVFDDVTDSLTNITGLQEGTYTLLWTVSNGNCTPVIDTVLINVFDQPVADAGIDQDICASYVGTLDAVASVGTSTGVWSEDVAFGNPSAVAFTNVTGESSDFTVTVEGQYQLIWTVSNGNCIAESDTVIINIYDQPTANAGLDEDLCNVYTTAFTGAALLGTSQGIWSNHPANAAGVIFADNSLPISGVSGLSEGGYQFIWTVSNGTCAPVSDIVDINVYDQPIANAGLDQDLCGIYTATLDANNPAGTSTGIWMLDNAAGPPSGVTFADATKFNTVVSGLVEGTYSLIWTTVNGSCPSASDTMVINVYDPPVANAGADIFLCTETSAILDGNINVGLASGQWSLDPSYGYPSASTFIDDLMYNTEINNLVVGDYPIIWTMQNGTCPQAQDTVWIYNQPLPLVSAVYPDEVCSNLCFDIQNTSSAPIGETITNVTWTLDGTNYANNLENICLTTAGTYPLDLVITASNGCVDSLVGSTDIIINPTPVAGFSTSPSDTLFELERVDIMNSASADVVIWYYNTGDTTIFTEADFIHFYENEGVYELTQLVTNQFGCQDSTLLNVYVNERQTVFVPNSFTPGDPDGINDYFGPVARAILDVDYEFLIFNRWGELLFSSTVYGENWDGTHQGQLVPTDSYVWKLSYRFENSSLIQTQMGHVIVVR